MPAWSRIRSISRPKRLGDAFLLYASRLTSSRSSDLKLAQILREYPQRLVRE